MAKASVVLSFHEVLLHRSDVELLDGPYWLNDTIISFYFEYLERNKFVNANELLFVSPEVTQCIKMVDTEEIKTFLEPLGVSRKKFVFFALNDNDSPDRAGGSHWSLLVYSKPESCFFHLDSLSGSNHNVAWEFASHLISYFTSGGACTFIRGEQDKGGETIEFLELVVCNSMTPRTLIGGKSDEWSEELKGNKFCSPPLAPSLRIEMRFNQLCEQGLSAAEQRLRLRCPLDLQYGEIGRMCTPAQRYNLV